MFTEEIVQEGNLYKITVSIKKRKYAYEKKLVHEGNVDNLIPPELVGKIRLISAPRKKVSNMARGQYISSGTWVYEIIVENIINVFAEQFPEFLVALAEENWINGYTQALKDTEYVDGKHSVHKAETATE